jgi:hypothetical protein
MLPTVNVQRLASNPWRGRSRLARLVSINVAAAGLAVPAFAAAPEVAWRSLQSGVEHAVLAGAGAGLAVGERLHVVRIDPGRASLVAAMAKAGDKQQRTAAKWCRDRKLAVAINLGMYATDHLTNVGHAHVPGHVNTAHWSSKYKSVLAFAPKKQGLPGAVLLDLDEPGSKERLADYGAAIQNLRLIRAPGRNVWAKQERRWSEAAVAMDKQGRVLFIFTRQPYSMHELNAKLLALPLGISNAMHVEGGPEASLSIHAGGVHLDLNGSYETGFNEDDGEAQQWPIPNVLGVESAEAQPRKKAGATARPIAPANPRSK